MTDNNGTAGKVLETFFEGSQSVYVNIVGRLVQQEHVTFLLQGHSQMQTITFSTGEYATLLFLVGTIEVETAQVGTYVDVSSAHPYEFIALRDNLEDTFIWLDVLMTLVNVSQFYGFAHLECSRVRFLQSHNHTE